MLTNVDENGKSESELIKTQQGEERVKPFVEPVKITQTETDSPGIE